MLRTALTAATREELVTRNVASLVEAPKVVSRETTPWSLDETLTFLEEARRDPLYAAFVLAIAMGLRRGEVLGLRWSDVDLDGRVIRISNQVQRIGGELYQDTTQGHNQISMTMDVYTHVAQDTQREAISHMDRLLKRRLDRD